MAEEPQPQTMKEGIDPNAPSTEQEQESTSTSRGGDSRKADAALSTLDSRAPEEHKPKTLSGADAKALDDAMARLGVSAGAATGSTNGAGSGGNGGTSGATNSVAKSPADEAEDARRAKRAAEKKRDEERKKIKVDAGDVALLVEELELSKVKATDLLRRYEGDAVKAMRGYVKAEA